MDIDLILQSIYNLVGHYGYLGVFILMFFENLGFPLPTEMGFIVGQTMVSTGAANYVILFIIILSGKTLGSIISYFIGRFFADRLRIKRHESKMKQAQVVFASWMNKYGDIAVLFSRLVGYIRPWSSYLAGVGEVRFVPFLIYNIIGSSIIIVITMFVLGGAVSLWKMYPMLRPLAIVLFLFFFFGFWIILYISKVIKSKRIKK